MQLHIQSAVLTWNEDKRIRNIREHGVDFSELASFFEGYLMTVEDERVAYGEQRFQSVGLFNQGCLFVVWTLRHADETPHIISARRANRYEAQKFYEYYSKYS
jgi:uncharacterized DUF497 family protein